MTREDREAFDDLDDDEKLEAYEIAVDDLAAVRRPIVEAYERFKHLDDLVERIDEPLDPFHAAARELWRAVKASLGANATRQPRGGSRVGLDAVVGATDGGER
jgi:hypothetical protein